MVLSQFAKDIRRTTAIQALRTNNLVAGLSAALLVPYANPGGRVWATVHGALNRKQAVLALDDAANTPLFELGARPLAAAEDLKSLVQHTVRNGQ